MMEVDLRANTRGGGHSKDDLSEYLIEKVKS